LTHLKENDYVNECVIENVHFQLNIKKLKFRVYKIKQPGEAEREGGERLRERYAERLRERERLKF